MEITKVTLDLVKVAFLAGYLLVIFGLLSLFFPKALLKINTCANNILVSLDGGTFTHKVASGIISLMLGSVILFSIYYFL